MGLNDRFLITRQKDIAFVAYCLGHMLGVPGLKTLVNEFGANAFILNVGDQRRTDKAATPICLCVEPQKFFILLNAPARVVLSDKYIPLLHAFCV